MGCSTRSIRNAGMAGSSIGGDSTDGRRLRLRAVLHGEEGDTLSKIARQFGTTVANLVALNGIANPDRIAAGTTICVKAKGSQPAGKYYTVKTGDTLYSIARKYGWTASYLAQVNTIPNPDEIYAGRVLWIPAH